MAGNEALYALLIPFGAIIISLVIYAIVMTVHNVRLKKRIKQRQRPRLSEEEKQTVKNELMNGDELKEKLAELEAVAQKLVKKETCKKVFDELAYLTDKAKELNVEKNIFTGFHIGESVVLINSAITLTKEDGYVLAKPKTYDENKKSCRFGESEDLRVDISPHFTDMEIAAMALLLSRRLSENGKRFETEFFDLLIMPKKYGNFYCDIATNKGESITLTYGIPPFKTASIVMKKEYYSE